MDAADRRKDIHIAPFSLFRNVIEHIDSVDVLLQSACVPASRAPLRVALESRWQLEYLLASDQTKFSQRSLSWLCAFYRAKLNEVETVDDPNQAGREFHDAWETQFGAIAPLEPSPDQTKRERDYYLKSLSAARLGPIQIELDRHPTRAPWFQAFDGPPNLRELCRRLGKLVEYDTVYRSLSMLSHGFDAEEYITVVADGKASVRLVRDPRDLPEVALLACFTQLGATRLLLSFYRGGEQLQSWYQREVKPKIIALHNLRGKIGIRYSLKET